MRILQVSTADRGGGAEGSARNLFEAFRARGHESWLAVGSKYSADPDVFQMPLTPAPTLCGRGAQRFAQAFRRCRAFLPGARRAARCLEILADPQRRRDRRAGREDFNFPGSHRFLELLPAVPDVIHCHNLHGWYFDLRCLPCLSRQYPVILNLRDTWLLSGHCAYFRECERWRTGCGECPDLKVYPGISRDATAENWQVKAEIYAQSRLFISAPSRWLLDCAKASMLRGVEYRVIPNGIDLHVFQPGDRVRARAELDLPADARIVLFTAAAKRSVYKDYATMSAAVAEIAERGTVPNLQFVCLGAAGRARAYGKSPIKYVPFESDPARVALFYQAADVYIHAARAEAFGKSITEAMACGTPVVATDVGGIPEQVVPGVTGFLAPLGDAHAMALSTEQLLTNGDMHRACGTAAAERGRQFGLERQADSFLEWYAEILAT